MSGRRPRKAVSVECAGRNGAVDVEAAASGELQLRGHGPRVVWATWLSSMLFVGGLCPVCVSLWDGLDPCCFGFRPAFRN